MTAFLTAQQILFIHSRLMATTGGEGGVRDLGLLESAVARPQATSDGKPLYPDLFHQAAALMESLTGNHPFVDGNKRTAITAASLFLRQNGYRVVTPNEELEQFTLDVTNKRLLFLSIAAWFEANTVPEIS